MSCVRKYLLFFALFIVGASVLFSPSAAVADSGPALRVVVLPRVSLDREPGDTSALESAANQALREAGLRPIALDATLRAQSFALADTVAAGRIPEGLTALNADAIWLVRLACDTAAQQVQGSMLSSCSCIFDRSLVRGEEVVFSESEPWTTGCLNSLQAVGRLLETKVPAALTADVENWKEVWVGDGTWDMDLLVTGLRDRGHARSLVDRIEALPGVVSVRLGIFSRTASRYSVRGEGRQAALRLAEHIEADESLGLGITHETDTLIHAELDFGRVHRRQARVLVVPPADVRPKTTAAVVADAGSDLVRSALANLRWIEVTDVEVGSATSDAPLERLLAASRDADEPVATVVSFRSSADADAGERWIVSTALIAPNDGREILDGTGYDSDPLAALDASVRDLDERFLAAVSDPGRRRQLGLPESAAQDAAVPIVRVASFDLSPMFPTRAREYRQEGLGTLKIENTTEDTITNASLEIRAAGTLASATEIGELPPMGSAEMPVVFETLPDLDPEATHRVQVEATVSFRSGESFGRVRAYAPLVVHRINALDWSEPRSLAAFIDPTDTEVRSLATRALARDLPDTATRSLSRAALLHEKLWHPPLRYVADPVTTAFDESIDDVQHPRQTLARLAGDCDDLTVLLASLYESVGLATAIVTTPGHVLLAVDSGLLAGGHLLLGEEKGRFIEVDGALFVPVEATAIGVGFEEAWRLGAEIINSAGDMAVSFRTRDAWRRYPTTEMALDAASELEVKEMDQAAFADALPSLVVPDTARDESPLAGPSIAWLSGDREAASMAAADACAEGAAEACYNLAVMLVAEAGGVDAEGEGDAPLPPLIIDALSLLPNRVVNMILDHGGLGMGDDASEASEEAVARRRMEEVLRRARERQDVLRERGEIGREVRIDPMGGRRGSPAAEPKELAPMFFFEPVGE